MVAYPYVVSGGALVVRGIYAPKAGKGLVCGRATAVLFILAISTCVSLGGLLDANLAPDEVTLRWVWAIGALLLGMASVLLVRWESSKVNAKVGIIWGLTALLAIWSISSLFSAAGSAILNLNYGSKTCCA